MESLLFAHDASIRESARIEESTTPPHPIPFIENFCELFHKFLLKKDLSEMPISRKLFYVRLQ